AVGFPRPECPILQVLRHLKTPEQGAVSVIDRPWLLSIRYGDSRLLPQSRLRDSCLRDCLLNRAYRNSERPAKPGPAVKPEHRSRVPAADVQQAKITRTVRHSPQLRQ